MRPGACVVLAFAWAILPAAADAQTYAEAYKVCLGGRYDYGTAVRDCTIVLESGRLTPLERAIALNNRAEAGAGAAARRDLDEAIRLVPTIAKFYHNRGLRWSVRSGEAEAIADLDTAIRLDPRYAVAYTSRGEAYADLKQYERAIRDFSAAIRLAPAYIHPMYNPYESRARAREELGDIRGAAADRKLYMPIMNRANPVPGPNASGRRAWEGWMTK